MVVQHEARPVAQDGQRPAAQDGQRPARRRPRRPASVVQRFDGNPHRLDMVAIDRAFFRRVVEGRYSARGDLAKAVGVSRSAVSRFFAGKQTSLRMVLAILAELGAQFDDVATPCDGVEAGR